MAEAWTLSAMMEICDFSYFSGLRLNRAKSTFMGFGLHAEEMGECSQILATPIRALSIQYLGMSLVDNRLRIQSRKVGRLALVETRLEGWRARLLSRGGRLVLLKAVLAAIPIYYMSIFKMPTGVKKRLKKSMRSFLLARLPAQGGKGGSARRMDSRVPSYVSGRARHTSLATHQHGTSD